MRSLQKGLKTIVIDADLEAPSLVHLVNNCSAGIGTTWVDFLEKPEFIKLRTEALKTFVGEISN